MADQKHSCHITLADTGRVDDLSRHAPTLPSSSLHDHRGLLGLGFTNSAVIPAPVRYHRPRFRAFN